MQMPLDFSWFGFYEDFHAFDFPCVVLVKNQIEIDFTGVAYNKISHHMLHCIIGHME